MNQLVLLYDMYDTNNILSIYCNTIKLYLHNRDINVALGAIISGDLI